VPSILIVDDERPIRDLLEALLRDAGYATTTAVHGAEALALVAKSPPDLVIADVMMPVLGGAELCRRLKADPATRAIPIVLMSAVTPYRSHPSGEDGFLPKPFDLDEVEALVDRWLTPPRPPGPPDPVGYRP
jgi:two-component system phosphate regulon response regulator PhoB